MSEVATNSYIYTDKCIDSVRDNIAETLMMGVIVRDEKAWDIGYITSMLTNPSLEVVVINTIDERSIAEITIAAFMCKKILVTSKVIDEYPSISSFITDKEIGCRLDIDNNSFIHWYEYTIGR